MESSDDAVPLLGAGLTSADMTVGIAFRSAARTMTETDRITCGCGVC